MPNPFYQIYEGAALLAGAEPYFMASDRGQRISARSRQRAGGSLAALPAAVPVLAGQSHRRGREHRLLRRALELADRYDFVVASDECYSEIYFDEAKPPPACCRRRSPPGTTSSSAASCFTACRSAPACPGLRSGFVAGDAALIKPFLLYRTYHGCAMPVHTQLASIPAWNDDAHVVENRTLYRQKFAAVLPILREVMDVDTPDASFYLWPQRRRRRALHARTVRAPARHGAARQLHRARHRRRQSRAAAACASRWSRACRSASRRRSGFASTC